MQQINSLPNSDYHLSLMHNEKMDWKYFFCLSRSWALMFQWDERIKVHEEQKKISEVPWGRVSFPLLITGTCVH